MSGFHHKVLHEIGHSLPVSSINNTRSLILLSNFKDRALQHPDVKQLLQRNPVPFVQGHCNVQIKSGEFSLRDLLSISLGGPAMDYTFKGKNLFNLSLKDRAYTAGGDVADISKYAAEIRRIRNLDLTYPLSPCSRENILKKFVVRIMDTHAAETMKSDRAHPYIKYLHPIQQIAQLFESAFIPKEHSKQTFLNTTVSHALAHAELVPHQGTLDISENVLNSMPHLKTRPLEVAYTVTAISGEAAQRAVQHAHYIQAKTSPILPAGQDPVERYYDALNAWKNSL
jgi:hypothetical protein